MKKFFEEFKKFALRGNVIDLAVGVIIGGAFTSIVNGVSNDFIKPLLAWIMGTKPEEILIGEAQWSWSLAASDFVTTIINFLITALVLFIMLLDSHPTRPLPRLTGLPDALASTILGGTLLTICLISCTAEADHALRAGFCHMGAVSASVSEPMMPLRCARVCTQYTGKSNAKRTKSASCKVWLLQRIR